MDLASLVSKQQKKYVDKGAKSGKQGLPPTGAAPYDLNETQLVSETRKLSQQNFHAYKNLVSAKSKVLSDIENGLGTVAPVCDAVLSNQDLAFTASQTMSVERAKLIKLAEKMLKLRAEIRSYCVIHNITEDAVYPENPQAPYLWLLPILLFETILGAAFYENSNGLIGGALVALGVSFLNVALAFACGAFFRYKNLSTPLQKLSGWAALVAAIVLGVFLNSLFAAYRGEYQLLTDPSDTQQIGAAFLVALNSARNVFLLYSPATDLSSFTLLFLGLAGFFFAFYKGMYVSDRYPGYGPRVRRLKEAEDAFETGCLALKEKVHTDLNIQKETLGKAKNTVMQAKPGVEQVRLALVNGHREMRAQQLALQNAFSLVLTSYRETNVAVRATDAPAYFAEIPNLVEVPLYDNGDDLNEVMEELINKIQFLKENYQAKLTDAISDMGNKTKQLLGVDYAIFIDEIISQGKNNIDKAHILAPKLKVAI